MNDKMKDAPAVPEPSAPNQDVSRDISTDASLSNSAGNVKAGNADKSGKKPRFKGDRTHLLGMGSKVGTLAVKFYAEQLPQGEQAMIDAICQTDKRGAQILAIKHDRDEVTNGLWAVASVKPHWHVIIRLAGKTRRTVLQLLRGLCIEFRPGLDDILLKNHGIETIGNFAGYAMYLTHETAEAIRDAKELYDVSELVSNMTPDEIEQIRAGYIKPSDKRKATTDELISMDKEAYDLGYALKSFDEWYDAMPFIVRSNAKMNTIRESYDRGVKARIDENKEIDRLCIFIQGEPNTGKTYAAMETLRGMGLNVLPVRGGGTGKLDKLRAEHDAIVFDDEVCPSLLNMADSYVCQPYRRNRDNPPWTGRYLVVTSNDDFLQWLAKCGLHPVDQNGHLTRHGGAMITRFVVCSIEPRGDGSNRLVIRREGINFRGDAAKQQRLADMLAVFKERYNAIISTYRPSAGVVDLSAVVDYYSDDDTPRPIPAGYGYEYAKGVV